MTDFKEYDFFIDYEKWGKAEIEELISIAERQGLTLQESITEFSPKYTMWSFTQNRTVTKRMKFKTSEYHANGISIEVHLKRSKDDRKVRVAIWNAIGLQYWQALINRDVFSGGPIVKTVKRMSHRELLEDIRPLAKTRILTKNDSPKMPSQEAETHEPLQPWEKIPWDEVSDNGWGKVALQLFCIKELTYKQIAMRLGDGSSPSPHTIMNFICGLRRDYPDAGIPNRKKVKKVQSVIKREVV